MTNWTVFIICISTKPKSKEHYNKLSVKIIKIFSWWFTMKSKTNKRQETALLEIKLNSYLQNSVASKCRNCFFITYNNFCVFLYYNRFVISFGVYKSLYNYTSADIYVAELGTQQYKYLLYKRHATICKSKMLQPTI